MRNWTIYLNVSVEEGRGKIKYNHWQNSLSNAKRLAILCTYFRHNPFLSDSIRGILPFCTFQSLLGWLKNAFKSFPRKLLKSPVDEPGQCNQEVIKDTN